jgi:ATP-dependent DNA ligase
LASAPDLLLSWVARERVRQTEGRWGEGLTAAKMAMCRWLEPFIVVRIEFLEWTPDDRRRHPRFARIRRDKDARESYPRRRRAACPDYSE